MPSLSPMYFSFSLAFGLGSGMTLFGCFNLILAYYPLKNSTRATVIPMANTNLGVFSLGPLTYFLQTRYGWRNMLRIMGSLIGVVCIPLSFLVLKPPSKSDTEDNTGSASGIGTMKYSEIASSKEDIADDNQSEGIEIQNDSPRHEISPETDDIITGSDDFNNTLRKGERRASDIKVLTYQESDSHHNPIYSILRTLLYPDVLLLSFTVFGYGLVNSFLVIQLVNFVISIGHTAEQGTQAVMVMSISVMIGKILLVLFADMAPFPKIGFFPISSFIGTGILFAFLWVHQLVALLVMTAALGATVMSVCDSLPFSVSNNTFGVSIGTHALPVIAFFHGAGFILASLLGESVDQTGSYDVAFYTCIGVYVVCASFCILVPVYQKCFVKDRFIMDVFIGCKHRVKKQSEQMSNEKEKAECVNEEEITHMVTDMVSSV
ncbi:uncharacterized protein LOC121424488 isoform X2 [Lytechinus variegatus]|nr:uncharacterized protein LOC121424488 isoform X2 [Lytechinus variegatus]